MIVAAIIGILAALVVPHVQGHATTAKESAARDNLHLLRSAIELYAAQHGDVAPGYENDNRSSTPLEQYFRQQTTVQEHYMRKVPVNPFNGLNTILMIGNGATFPAEATGTHGWVYQPATKTIRLDWPGTDSDGVFYFAY
jgi:general secretion pathway protein G